MIDKRNMLKLQKFPPGALKYKNVKEKKGKRIYSYVVKS